MNKLGVVFLSVMAMINFPSNGWSAEDTMTEVNNKKLIEVAKEVRQNAYAPYSRYLVGCAILTSSGHIYAGCNVENASYGLTICAERNAVFQAIAKGEKEIVAAAVVTRDGGYPCGGCRQVLNEFGPKMKVYVGNEHGDLVDETTLDKLLPDAFGPHNL